MKKQLRIILEYFLAFVLIILASDHHRRCGGGKILWG